MLCAPPSPGPPEGPRLVINQTIRPTSARIRISRKITIPRAPVEELVLPSLAEDADVAVGAACGVAVGWDAEVDCGVAVGCAVEVGCGVAVGCGVTLGWTKRVGRGVAAAGVAAAGVVAAVEAP